MLIGDVCNRTVISAPRETTVRAAATLMREHHIGDVIVVDRADADQMPIGIVTDRDVAVKVVSCGLDPATTTLGELVRWGDVACVQETETYATTLDLMHAKAIRRMPVINAAGVLVGVISIDDMLPRLARELAEIAELTERGRRREIAATT